MMKLMGGQIVNVPSGLPAWRQGQSINTVVSLANTIPASAGAGAAEQMVRCWNGAAFDEHSMYIVCNGGHNDLNNNAAYRLDLSADVPAWEILNSGTPSGSKVTNVYYQPFDGKPCSRHSAYSPIYIPRHGRVMLFQCRFSAGDPPPTSEQVDGFKVTPGSGQYEYDAAGTWTDTEAVVGIYATYLTFARHPITDDVYFMFAYDGPGTYKPGTIWRWDSATDDWGPQIGDWNTRYMQQSRDAFIDVARNRIVSLATSTANFGSPPANSLACWDLTTGALTYHAFTGASLDDSTDDPPQSAMTHDTDADQYYLLGQLGSLYRIDPDTYLFTKIGSEYPTVNGPFNRFRYMSELKGIAMIPTGDGNSKFLVTGN